MRGEVILYVNGFEIDRVHTDTQFLSEAWSHLKRKNLPGGCTYNSYVLEMGIIHDERVTKKLSIEDEETLFRFYIKGSSAQGLLPTAKRFGVSKGIALKIIRKHSGVIEPK